MKITVEDASALPEGLRGLVMEGELDLAGLMPAEDLTGLKSALQKERATAGSYSKLGTPDEIAAKMADLQAKADKGGKGGEEAQAKLDAMRADYESKLSERDQRLSKLVQNTAAASLKAELAKAGFIPEAIDDIAATAMGRLAFGDDGQPKVMTADGKPMIGSGADHGATLADLAKELASQKRYALLDGGKGGGGKPPESGGKPTGKAIQRAAFDAMGQGERAEYIKSGGKVIDA